MQEIVQVIPNIDYTVTVYFSDGKITLYDVKPFLGKGVFQKIADVDTFVNRCRIIHDTLAWDVGETEDECIDIDPDTLYEAPEIIENLA
ncbi:MAG: DUF2442 domain-containing protein [Lachnospiraceae bacterium]|jgi:hypothetical protein|nr:DUF2442 domain-containing protein [Lachnospiraceae bacterium]